MNLLRQNNKANERGELVNRTVDRFGFGGCKTRMEAVRYRQLVNAQEDELQRQADHAEMERHLEVTPPDGYLETLEEYGAVK